MDSEKYIGYADLGIADTMPSSGLSGLRSPQRLFIIEQRCLRVPWVDQFTRHSPDVTPGAHAHEKAPHVPLAQTSIERALKVEMPAHGLYRCIKSGLLTDPSESISRGPAILRN